MLKKIKNKILIFMITLISVSLLVSCQSEKTSFDDILGFNQGLDILLDQERFSSKKLNNLTDDEEDFVDSPLNDFKAINTATVVFNEGQAIITHDMLDTDIYMENGNLIVNSSRKMTLVISGNLEGNITINKPDGKLKLVLNGVSIQSELGPAINLQTEKRVFLVINDNTVNHVIDGSEHPLMSNGSKTKAAIFSEEQIIISGYGELNVTGRYQHGIASDDYIKVLSGKINILSAKSDGFRANEYVVIDGGDIEINADGDGIECERGFIAINGGSIQITAKKMGVKALYEGDDPLIQSFITITNGIIQILSDDKGIAASHHVTIYDGAIKVISQGDAVFAHHTITIENGLHYLNSLDKQVLDGRLAVSISGGTSLLYSFGSEVALQSREGQIAFSGGTVVVAGALDIMLQTTSQGYLKIGNIEKNEIIQLKKETAIITIGFLNAFSHVIISTQEINPGVAYDLYSSGHIQGNNFYGLFQSGNYTNAAHKKVVTAR
jgi:hypothetical protein